MAEVSNKSPDPLDVALGASVRIRRRSIGMSQEALAEQCGVSFQQIQKYENGANRISFSRLVQIARALKCRVTDLMDVLDTPAGAYDRNGKVGLGLIRQVLAFQDQSRRQCLAIQGRVTAGTKNRTLE